LKYSGNKKASYESLFIYNNFWHYVYFLYVYTGECQSQLNSFGQPVEVRLQNGELQWVYPALSNSVKEYGVVT